MVWIPGIPENERDGYLGTPIRIPNHRAPNQQLTISWFYFREESHLEKKYNPPRHHFPAIHIGILHVKLAITDAKCVIKKSSETHLQGHL